MSGIALKYLTNQKSPILMYILYILLFDQHCSAADLVGAKGFEPWNYSIQTYSLPRISSLPVTAGRVRRSKTPVIQSHRAKSNRRQADTKDVSGGRGKANKKKRSDVHLLTFRQCLQENRDHSHPLVPEGNIAHSRLNYFYMDRKVFRDPPFLVCFIIIAAKIQTNKI